MKQRSLLVVALLAAAGGCSIGDGAEAGDHLSTWQQFSRLCMGTDNSYTWTVGAAVINDSDVPITLKSVSLIDASKFELIDAVLVPVVPELRVGNVDSWPPAERDQPERWSERVPAAGSVLEPGSDWDLAIGIRSLSSADAETAGIRLLYEVGDLDFEHRTTGQIFMSSNCRRVMDEQQS